MIASWRKSVAAWNKRAALWMAAWFSTMTCFWLFTALSLLPIVWPESMNVIQFISSGVLQLIALPLLGVAGVIIGQKAETRAEEDHKMLIEEMSMHRVELKKIKAILAALHIEDDGK